MEESGEKLLLFACVFFPDTGLEERGAGPELGGGADAAAARDVGRRVVVLRRFAAQNLPRSVSLFQNLCRYQRLR